MSVIIVKSNFGAFKLSKETCSIRKIVCHSTNIPRGYKTNLSHIVFHFLINIYLGILLNYKNKINTTVQKNISTYKVALISIKIFVKFKLFRT